MANRREAQYGHNDSCRFPPQAGRLLSTRLGSTGARMRAWDIQTLRTFRALTFQKGEHNAEDATRYLRILERNGELA